LFTSPFGFVVSLDSTRLYPSIIPLCQGCVNRVFRLLGFNQVGIRVRWGCAVGGLLVKTGFMFGGFVHSRNSKHLFLFLLSLYCVKASPTLFTRLGVLFTNVHSLRNKVFTCGFNRLREFNGSCSLVNKSMTPKKRVFLPYCQTVSNLTM